MNALESFGTSGPSPGEIPSIPWRVFDVYGFTSLRIESEQVEGVILPPRYRVIRKADTYFLTNTAARSAVGDA